MPKETYVWNLLDGIWLRIADWTMARFVVLVRLWRDLFWLRWIYGSEKKMKNISLYCQTYAALQIQEKEWSFWKQFFREQSFRA